MQTNIYKTTDIVLLISKTVTGYLFESVFNLEHMIFNKLLSMQQLFLEVLNTIVV